jgi:WhiB family transcriptional regulator, redox-sensing transcriptional regulator
MGWSFASRLNPERSARSSNPRICPFEESPALESSNNGVEMQNEWVIDWQQLAACRGEDAAHFFAPGYFERRAEKNAREAVAKAICARCPVRRECLDYALSVQENHGVWGGMNEMERRAVLRQRAREAV